MNIGWMDGLMDRLGRWMDRQKNRWTDGEDGCQIDEEQCGQANKMVCSLHATTISQLPSRFGSLLLLLPLLA